MSFSKKQIPNLLTVFRIILVPIILVFLLLPTSLFPEAYQLYRNPFESIHINNNVFYWNWIIAGILFIVASISDFFDGYLARKNNWVSNFGKLWDPIADKVLVNTILVCFAYLKVIPIWIAVIMIARDIIVDATRMQASSKNIIVPANIYGKLKTITQMVGIIMIFFFFNQSLDLSNTDNIVWYYCVQNLAMLFATFFSILSGIIYVIDINKMIKAKRVKNA